MIKYALDTNIVTYYLKGNKIIINRVTEETDNKNIIVIPPRDLILNEFVALTSHSKMYYNKA